MMDLSRTDRSFAGAWWWTVDRWLLAALALLLVIGVLLSPAASPDVAARLGLPPFYFVYRQLVFLAAGALIMIAVSFVTPRQAYRLALAVLAASHVLMVMTLWLGPEINGATRWLLVGGVSLQPSEFVKPSFAVTAAWLMSRSASRDHGGRGGHGGHGGHGGRGAAGFPGRTLSALLLMAVVSVLMLQPDMGQAALLTLTWLILLFISGAPAGVLLMLGAGAMLGAVAVYRSSSHVASRVDRFLDPATGDTFQSDRALDAFRAGGLAGRGPGEGQVKQILPDAHTDYVFAAAAEEYGMIACGFILLLFAFIVMRGLHRTVREWDHPALLSAAALLVLFALQALINMAVNLNVLPSKGMTLPFISYGGSSLLALSLTMGLALALTRRRPGMWLATQGARPRSRRAPATEASP